MGFNEVADFSDQQGTMAKGLIAQQLCDQIAAHLRQWSFVGDQMPDRRRLTAPGFGR
jgi:3-deoxy-D-manno-octulosonate 8-phosphate phosphatase KdsC-like HAD superfamily phosphatase